MAFFSFFDVVSLKLKYFWIWPSGSYVAGLAPCLHKSVRTHPPPPPPPTCFILEKLTNESNLLHYCCATFGHNCLVDTPKPIIMRLPVL